MRISNCNSKGITQSITFQFRKLGSIFRLETHEFPGQNVVILMIMNAIFNSVFTACAINGWWHSNTAWCSEIGSLSGHWMHLSCMHQWRQRTNFTAPGCTSLQRHNLSSSSKCYIITYTIQIYWTYPNRRDLPNITANLKPHRHAVF